MQLTPADPPEPPPQVHEALSDSGLFCLTLLLRYHRLPVDPAQIRHDYAPSGKPMEERQLLLAARGMGLKARAAGTGLMRLDRAPLPAIARRKEGGFFVLAEYRENKVVVQYPGERPKVIPLHELDAVWTSRLIYLTRRATLSGDARRFDFTWFIPSVIKYRGLFGEVLLASFFLQIFGLMTPLFFQVVIDKVLVHRGLTTLDVLIIGLVAISVFEIVLGGLRTYVMSHTSSRVDVELGARLFRHLLALPVSYFETRPVGQTVARVRELENIRSFLTGSALTVLLDLLFTVVFFAVMYFFSPTLTYIVLASIPFYAGLSIAITGPLRHRIEERFQRGAASQAFLVESVSGAETLKSMAVEPQMRQRWEELLAAYVRSSFRAVILGTIGSQGVMLVNKVVTALLLWFGARLVIDGALSVGELVAFNMLAGQVNQPILRLAQLWQDFQQFRISIARLGDVLNTPAEPAATGGRHSLPSLKGNVTFQNVSFRYRSDGPEILQDVDFAVPQGQVVAVVGRSGSGKSTLTKLIQRLYVPERGRVLIDDVDLALVEPSWLRRQVGVVLQENVLFNASVRDNVALSDPSLSMERVVEAARLSGAHEFILGLPHGYDTELGERGTSLSGGQRQRIAIARALVANPRILIFDEATSALDYESERLIQENMRRICHNRTVFIVAHRLSTVRHADRIMTIEQGRLIEDGSHEELTARGGRYASLYRQMAREDVA